MTYRDFHRRSIQDPDGFWTEQANLIDWQRPFQKALDYSKPPFARWFVSGETNLCHNAIDRHLAKRGDQKALVWISTEVDQTRTYTYRELAADEPARKRRLRVVQHLLERPLPVDESRLLGPEAFAVLERTSMEVAVGHPASLRRSFSVF